LFSLCHLPALPRREGVLFFPPFAEEMNKSRRTVALTAQRLASIGYVVLIVDPFGTGDSEGEFADARWEIWREDMFAAMQWLRSQGIERLNFWALRLGALLAIDTAPRSPLPLDRLALWAPVSDGGRFMAQFIRLKIAAGMLAGAGPAKTEQLRDVLERNGSLEIAGYRLSSALVQSIERMDIGRLAQGLFRQIVWFDVLGQQAEPSPATLKAVKSLGSAPPAIRVSVREDAFWGSPEISVARSLITQTEAFFRFPPGNGWN
jgi:exosortase A-associated hydrolase 2